MLAIVNNKPYCAYIVNNLVQYMSNPGLPNWQGIKRIFGYINGTISIGIKYQKCKRGIILLGFSDTNWVGDHNTCRSTCDCCFLLASGSNSWAL